MNALILFLYAIFYFLAPVIATGFVLAAVFGFILMLVRRS